MLPKNVKKFDEFFQYWSLSGAEACKSCRSRQELSNEYFLAKFGVDTAENEPAKNLQKVVKFANFADPNPLTLTQTFKATPGHG